MAEVAAHLTDRVLPWLPVRQWVLSVPKRLRPYLHSDPKVASGVLRVFLRAIRSTLHATSPGAPACAAEIQLGAVSFLHRFGSSLNAHFHYHVVVLDGVFSGTDQGGVEFHEASELETRHWQDLQRTVQKRVLRYFRRHDLLDESTTADMLTWQGTGGFSIDASVRIEGHDRHGLERLVRYCARPPFALHRLHAKWATRRCGRPMPASSTGYPVRHPTGGAFSSFLSSSCSSAWGGSFLHPVSIAIAITECLPRTPGSVPR
jgi:hypothetical protein